jgi:3-oxoacyl-[acyl-carrier protein] reductase
MSFDLEGQIAIVTGAARGIGLGVSQRLHELGVKVAGWDINTGTMPSEPAFAHAVEVDVTDESSVGAGFEATVATLGQVDILVNNAGINGPTKPVWEYTLAEWNNVMAVDLTGVFLCSRAVLPHMRDRNYGRIVTVASVASKEGNPGASPYGAAKAGVVGLCKGLSREVADSGITVNCITPAITETDLFKEMSADYIADKKSRIPMGRFCTIPEIADMVAWAASPRCSFTTGACFDLSGGRATY